MKVKKSRAEILQLCYLKILISSIRFFQYCLSSYSLHLSLLSGSSRLHIPPGLIPQPENRRYFMFNADQFRDHLSALTINSRVIIEELTIAAEKNPDNADEIAKLVMERVRRCLPKHKIFAFYLLDSICKNVGNPYNVIFSSHLYSLFTDTYLVVTDTPTRQDLINLFKTWPRAKTSAGIELFPATVLKKIELFIINATSIGSNQNATKISPDMLLREANYLLQYVITMDKDLELLSKRSRQDADFVAECHRIRHKLIAEINAISESIMASSKPQFDAHLTKYHESLQLIRKQLDDQSFRQQQRIKQASPEETGPRELKPPDFSMFISMTAGPEADSQFKGMLEGWGRVIVQNRNANETEKERGIDSIANQPVQFSQPPLPAEKLSNQTNEPNSEPNSERPNSEDTLSSSLGLTFSSASFMNSLLPETTYKLVENEKENENETGQKESVEPTFKSGMKRKTAGEVSEPKRVRFSDDVESIEPEEQ